MNKTIVHLLVSPKRQFTAQVFLDFLKDNFLKIPSLHTVCWQALLLKSARHTVQDLWALAAHSQVQQDSCQAESPQWDQGSNEEDLL